MVGLFFLSALVPLTLCAALLYGQFSSELSRSTRQSLDGLLRSFGMTLLARLGSADDALKVILTAPGATDVQIEADVAKLPWVARARRTVPDRLPPDRGGDDLPMPDSKQVRAMSNGASSVVWSRGQGEPSNIYLVHVLPSGNWLYAEVNPLWLWADAQDFAGDVALTLLDDQGRALVPTGGPPARSGDSPGAVRTASTRVSRSWEIFLASRFSSPSWRLVAVVDAPTLLTVSNGSFLSMCALIVFTILLITWLSLSSIRRQLLPLDLLTKATRRLADRDFDAFRHMTWNDEFGDLAQSFRTMAAKLKVQFSALEKLADIDRLLLSTPRLELILDTLLPHVAEVMRCHSVSVVLFDSDSGQSACVYDYYSQQAEQLPVRRLSCDGRALREACSAKSAIDAASALNVPCLAPIVGRGIAKLSLYALKNAESCIGALCIGHINTEAADIGESPVGGADFADRLSLILSSVRLSEQLRYQASFDSLTGLQNRRLFAQSVDTAVALAAERRAAGALLYIDLDLFKRVNDTAGHVSGDLLLRIVSERLKGCVDGSASIARLGGDEFAILLPRVGRTDDAVQVAERIIASLQPPIEVNGREHQISASIGITEFPADGRSLEELLKTGDIAMYQAKDAGRGRAVVFRREMQQKVLERERLEHGLHRAFRDRGLTVHYQPIVSAANCETVAVEALARWPAVDLGEWVSPAEFIAVAEENGLIVRLGDWVLRSACEQFTRWRSSGVGLQYVSVNVSVRQLKEPHYFAMLLAALRDSGMKPTELQIEITESVLAHEAEVHEALKEIAAHGIRLALDDFGTGYSSLSYLHAYPFHAVKIDRTFVRGLPGEKVSCRLAESIIVMCTSLGMEVVAEGVETEAQWDFLRRAGCTKIQGYLVARPMEAAELPGFLSRSSYPSHPGDSNADGAGFYSRRESA